MNRKVGSFATPDVETQDGINMGQQLKVYSSVSSSNFAPERLLILLAHHFAGQEEPEA